MPAQFIDEDQPPALLVNCVITAPDGSVRDRCTIDHDNPRQRHELGRAARLAFVTGGGLETWSDRGKPPCARHLALLTECLALLQGRPEAADLCERARALLGEYTRR